MLLLLVAASATGENRELDNRELDSLLIEWTLENLDRVVASLKINLRRYAEEGRMCFVPEAHRIDAIEKIPTLIEQPALEFAMPVLYAVIDSGISALIHQITGSKPKDREDFPDRRRRLFDQLTKVPSLASIWRGCGEWIDAQMAHAKELFDSSNVPDGIWKERNATAHGVAKDVTLKDVCKMVHVIMLMSWLTALIKLPRNDK